MNSIFVKIVLFFSLFAVGCSPVYYKPNLMNTPNFKEKGEIYLAGHLGDKGHDVQAAFAVSDHIFVQGNYMVQQSEGSTLSNNTNTKTIGTLGKMGEVAVGYFMPIDKEMTFSVCGGYGSGSVINNRTNEGSSRANIGKLFVQPTIGLRMKYFECIISAKVANLSYSNLSQNFTNQEHIRHFDALKSPIPIVEGAGIMRFGGERVKLQLQLTTMKLIGGRAAFQYDDSSLGVGVCVQLNSKKGF
jgi:hypothetical protein